MCYRSFLYATITIENPDINPDVKPTSLGQGTGHMMNKCQKAARKRFSKGFEEETGGTSGQNKSKNSDAAGQTLGQTSGHQYEANLPIWMGEVAAILCTKNRDFGEYSAAAIAQVCRVDDSTIRNRWLKSINSEIADEGVLKVDGKFTELAMELFAHIAGCRDQGLNPAQWVHRVLKPAIASIPSQAKDEPVQPNEYQTALARREQENETQSKAVEIKWSEMKRRRDEEAEAQQGISAADLERIRLEEKEKLMVEVETRDRIRRELMAELGLL